MLIGPCSSVMVSAVSMRPRGLLVTARRVAIPLFSLRVPLSRTAKVEELQQLIAAILGAPRVRPSDRLAEDLEAESMDVVNIVAAVEDRYEVALDDAALAEVRTVADLHEVVRAARK